MELIQGTRKSSIWSTKDDIISSMPDIVITHIMNLLPIRDTVRTSILARNWRYKWTMLTKLVFGENMVASLRGLHIVGNDERNISRLFIHLKGPIKKFVLYVPDEKILNDNDLCHWVRFLSRKGIMKFTLVNYNEMPIKLPTHLFSCLELIHLKLYNCHLPSAPTFCSFPNLLRLDLSLVTFASGFCEILSLCPLLEILMLLKEPDEYPILKVKLVEIAKLKNLKKLILPLRKLDSSQITNSLIFHLGGSFPKLQGLFLSFQECKFVVEAVSRKLVCDSFSCLRTLTLDFIDFSCSIMLPFVFQIIWGCPNLQTLNINASDMYAISSPALCPSEFTYITMGQLQLVNVWFSSFRGSVNELFFIKNLLAYSPLLKKITIRPDPNQNFGGYKGMLMLTMKLLRLPRASTIADVDLQWWL